MIHSIVSTHFKVSFYILQQQQCFVLYSSVVVKLMIIRKANLIKQPQCLCYQHICITDFKLKTVRNPCLDRNVSNKMVWIFSIRKIFI